jgi:P27 family predicted phage terminase small subunit
MAGRKPLPTHLELVKGTARPLRINREEPRPPIAVPAPPSHLDERARTRFAEIATMLARHGVMTELDTSALARYSVVWCRWVDSESEVKRRGPVVKTEAATRFRTHSFQLQTNACCKWHRSRVSSDSRHPAGPAFALPRRRMPPILSRSI